MLELGKPFCHECISPYKLIYVKYPPSFDLSTRGCPKTCTRSSDCWVAAKNPIFAALSV